MTDSSHVVVVFVVCVDLSADVQKWFSTDCSRASH